jgi:RND family efflux transporter MFP subunit
MFDESPSAILLERFQALCASGVEGSLTDRELLDRFLQPGHPHADSAFGVLLSRHGPMVLQVCQRSLRDLHAAEDAFQATFLVLARQAASIRNRDSVASWLFGVACRASARIRSKEAQRGRLERFYATLVSNRADGEQSTDDSWSDLHSEVERLPAKYRLPIVLCYFEGLTHEQAASRLCWPVGTVKIRLTRARDRLRRRLASHAPGAAAILAAPIEPLARAEPSRVLTYTTANAAIQVKSGITAGELVSTSVTTIVRGVLRDMLFTKLRWSALVLLCLATVGLGGLAVAQRTTQRAEPLREQPPASTGGEARTQATLNLAGRTGFNPDTTTIIRPRFECRVDKVLVQPGSMVKKGDPLLELFSTELAGAKNNYEIATRQWRRDKEVLERQSSPNMKAVLSKVDLMDSENQELKSRLQMKAARDQLLVYGLIDAQIETIPDEEGSRRANMVLCSPVSGLVVERLAVRGNLYEPKHTLLVISRDDPLWVTALVPESEISRLELGERLSVRVPGSDLTLGARLEAIGAEVHPDTGTVQIRASIPNPDHRLKAGMFVSVELEGATPPEPQRAASPARQTTRSASVDDRLNELERKLERLLTEKAESSSNAKILERLNEIERKVDRLLEPNHGK